MKTSFYLALLILVITILIVIELIYTIKKIFQKSINYIKNLYK